jgi:hypothetical protein
MLSVFGDVTANSQWLLTGNTSSVCSHEPFFLEIGEYISLGS